MSSPSLNLQPHPEIAGLRGEAERLNEALAELVLQRDLLQRTVLPGVAAEYQLKIGHLEYQVFWTDCELRALKRRIELAQAMLNRGDLPCYESIEKQINHEFAKWREQIAGKRREIKRANEFTDAPKLSGADSKRLQTLYRNLARRLHPDFNEPSVRAAKLWLQTADAYREADLPQLETLWLIVENNAELNQENNRHTFELWQAKKAKLLRAVERANRKLREIRCTAPYIWQNILCDKSEIARLQTKLKNELAAFAARRRELTETWADAMQHAKDREIVPSAPPALFAEDTEDAIFEVQPNEF